MKAEDKELLLRDLCARLPYKVIIYRGEKDYIGEDDALLEGIDVISGICKLRCLPEGTVFVKENVSNIIPFLRPMSSMTEKEKKEAKENGCIIYWDTSPEDKGLMVIASQKGFDWLNKNMFDYRGLIPMNLAIEAPKGMYNTK